MKHAKISISVLTAAGLYYVYISVKILVVINIFVSLT
jgi:hypothetical protein